MKIEVINKLDSAQLLLLNQIEEKFLVYVKSKLNEDGFNDLRVIVTMTIQDKKSEAVEYNSNEGFNISGSKALDSLLKAYIKKVQLPIDILNSYTLCWNIHYEPKKRESASQKISNATGKVNDNVDLPNFLSTTPRFSFSQIILPEKVKDDIFDALNVITNKELIYDEWGFCEVDNIPRSILNFYGDPGTGKTMCAHAIADYLGKDIMCLNYAEIESKFMGESTKNLKHAFEIAKDKNCVMFFDEADSFLGKRIQNVTQGSEQAINSLRSQMLILLEQFDGVVLFATNLVTNFDKAFESRILKHIHFELPNQEARVAIIKKMLPAKLPFENALTEQQFMEASALIDGLAGREIKNAILDMLTREANAHGKSAVFSFDKLCAALSQRKSMIDKLNEEKDKEIKAKIEKKLKEKSMEAQVEQDSEKLTDEYLLTVGFRKEKDNIFIKDDIKHSCKIIRDNNGTYYFPTRQDTSSNQIFEKSIIVNRGDLQNAIKELYTNSQNELNQFNF